MLMSYGTTVRDNSVMKFKKKSNLKLDVLSLVPQNLLKLTNSTNSVEFSERGDLHIFFLVL